MSASQETKPLHEPTPEQLAEFSELVGPELAPTLIKYIANFDSGTEGHLQRRLEYAEAISTVLVDVIATGDKEKAVKVLMALVILSDMSMATQQF